MPPTLDGPRSEFGVWLHATLAARMMSQTDLANRIGVDQSVVSKWTKGRLPKPEGCRQLADALGVPEAEVLERAGHIVRTTDLDRVDPTRARLHALVDQLDASVLEPHLAIMERTLALLRRESNA